MSEQTPATPVIEPGDEFEVRYGNGKRATVVALSGKNERKLAALIKQMVAAEQSGDPMQALDLFDIADEAAKLAMPSATDEFLESLDASAKTTIASNCLGKQSLGAEDKKKSESPH